MEGWLETRCTWYRVWCDKASSVIGFDANDSENLACVPAPTRHSRNHSFDTIQHSFLERRLTISASWMNVWKTVCVSTYSVENNPIVALVFQFPCVYEGRFKIGCCGGNQCSKRLPLRSSTLIVEHHTHAFSCIRSLLPVAPRCRPLPPGRAVTPLWRCDQEGVVDDFHLL